MTHLTLNEAALAAAHAASAATAELLRYAREGDAATNFAIEPETVQQLCEALKLTIDVDIDGVRATHPPGAALLDKLHAACTGFLEDWA